MKYLSVLFMLFSSLLLQAEEPLSREEMASQALLEWKHGFYNHLLEQDDPELWAYGIFLSHPYTNKPPADHIRKLLTGKVNQLVNVSSANMHALWLISDLCRSEQVYPECDINRLNDQMISRYGDHLLPFFEPLSQAMQAGIEGEVVAWIKQMAEASHFHLMMDNSQAFTDALDLYASTHPLPAEYLYEQLGIGYLPNLDEFTATELNHLNDHAQEYMLMVMKINFSLKMPIPSFKSMLDACKTYQELTGDCVAIGQLMVKDDGQYLSTVIGHKIQAEALSLAGKTEAAAQAEQKQKALKAEMDCLSRLFRYPLFSKMDLAFMRENMQIKRQQGERASMIHSARFFHQQALKNNPDEAAEKDPESCLLAQDITE